MANRSQSESASVSPTVKYVTAKVERAGFEITLTQEYHSDCNFGHYNYVITHLATGHIIQAGHSVGGVPDGDAIQNAIKMMSYFRRCYSAKNDFSYSRIKLLLSRS